MTSRMSDQPINNGNIGLTDGASELATGINRGKIFVIDVDTFSFAKYGPGTTTFLYKNAGGRGDSAQKLRHYTK